MGAPFNYRVHLVDKSGGPLCKQGGKIMTVPATQTGRKYCTCIKCQRAYDAMMLVEKMIKSEM